MTTAFQFKDIDGAMEFWTRVKDRNAHTEKERIAILVEMAQEGYMQSVMQTGRTKEELMNDWSKHYNMLHVKGEDTDVSSRLA